MLAEQLRFPLNDTRLADVGVDPEEVRQELIELLDTARTATVHAPWDERTQRYHRVVFPQMAAWLPKDEAEQMSREFAAEMARIATLPLKDADHA